MPKYRKKPVIIEAIQYDGENSNEILDFVGAKTCGHEEGGNGILIKTLEGDMVADKNDFVIKGVKGEFYPCKPDIFEMTYELVE